jgi:hypothetical protein
MNEGIERLNSHLVVAMLDNIPLDARQALSESGVDAVDCSVDNSHSDSSFWNGGHPSAAYHRHWATCLSAAMADRVSRARSRDS